MEASCIEEGNAYAIVMSVQVCFSLKLFRAWGVANHGGAGVRIFALWVVRLHVRFPVVASLEEFATDTALMRGFLWCGPLTLLLNAVDTGQNRCCVKFRSSVFTHHVHIVAVSCNVWLGPVTGLTLVKVV